MTTTIKGRTRYADSGTTRVTIRNRGRTEILVIEGGLIEPKSEGDFVIGAKHSFATDYDGDSVYVAYLEGAGLTFKHMNPNGFVATGVVLKANYYPEEIPDDTTKFVPPSQPWQPGVYEFVVEFLAQPEPDIQPKDAL